MHEINKWRIPVYIFENHAAAIKAWYKHRESHPALITFDDHTDTFPPLWRQREDFPDHRDAKQIDNDWLNLLKRTKNKIDTINTDDFFQEGDILRKQGSGGFCKLWYDEQILTAICLGIIGKAYICAPTSFNPSDLTEIPEILELYKKVEYLNELLDSFTGSPIFNNDSELLASSLVELARLHRRCLKNSTLSILYKYGFASASNYILDIDLDFFKTPFFSQMSYEDYGLFFKLVKNAKAITIATECDWVSRSCGDYLFHIDNFNKEAEKLNLQPLVCERWTSKEALHGLLSLIEYELSGQRAQQDEKCRKYNEMNDLHTLLAKNRKKQ